MYSFWQRVGAVASFFTSCLFMVLPIIAALNFAMKGAEPSVSLVVDNVSSRLGVEDYFMNKKVMLTDLVFNLDADFGSVFHWNTKQLFLYAVLEYETEKYSRNQIVIWDKIVRATDNKRLSISNIKSKYPSVDIEDQLPGKEVTLKLHWNTVSHVGCLFDSHKGEALLKIPDVGEKFVRTPL